MEKFEWVVKVDEKLQSMQDTSKEMEHWRKRAIYKMPAGVTDLNKKAYKPQTVSFGPYHHGQEHLKQMEEHKHRALLHYLKRSNKPLQVLVDALNKVVQDLKDCYDVLDASWKNDSSKFLQLIIVDGCFMLEVLRTATETSDDYASNDPIFSNHGRLYVMPYIRRDMLLIENQLPMLLLNKLAVESGLDAESLNRLILKLCAPNTQIWNMSMCLHVLDVYRKSLLQDGRPRNLNQMELQIENTGEIIRSATELHEAGIRIEKNKTGSLRDISFHGGVLRLPVIVVDDTTESMFLNLMAFERFHVGAGNELTSYIFFMFNIIDNASDVSLLHEWGIIQNAMGSNKAVAKLFNELSKDITPEPGSSLDMVSKIVNGYCKKSWNKWRASLIHTYFRNPWAIISFIAAVFLMILFLTVAQTVYTIYPYYHPSQWLLSFTFSSYNHSISPLIFSKP